MEPVLAVPCKQNPEDAVFNLFLTFTVTMHRRPLPPGSQAPLRLRTGVIQRRLPA